MDQIYGGTRLQFDIKTMNEVALMGVVKHETIVKSFKKCSTSSVLDGTENDIFEESESPDISINDEYDSHKDFLGGL